MPDLEATGSLAIGCPPAEFAAFRDAHPDRTVGNLPEGRRGSGSTCSDAVRLAESRGKRSTERAIRTQMHGCEAVCHESCSELARGQEVLRLPP